MLKRSGNPLANGRISQRQMSLRLKAVAIFGCCIFAAQGFAAPKTAKLEEQLKVSEQKIARLEEQMRQLMGTKIVSEKDEKSWFQGGLKPSGTATEDSVKSGATFYSGGSWTQKTGNLTIEGIPSGTIVAYGGSSAPADWLMCDGSVKNTTTYADLFAVIGYTYGGSGSAFNLPDLQQRFPLGKADAGTGSTLGGTGGAIDHTHTGPSHTHTYSEVIAHTHTGTTNSDGAHTHSITDPGHIHSLPLGSTAGGTGPTRQVDAIPSKNSGTAYTGITINSAGSAHTHAFTTEETGSASGTTDASGTGATGLNNPPFLVVNYIIKY